MQRLGSVRYAVPWPRLAAGSSITHKPTASTIVVTGRWRAMGACSRDGDHHDVGTRDEGAGRPAGTSLGRWGTGDEADPRNIHVNAKPKTTPARARRRAERRARRAGSRRPARSGGGDGAPGDQRGLGQGQASGQSARGSATTGTGEERPAGGHRRRPPRPHSGEQHARDDEAGDEEVDVVDALGTDGAAEHEAEDEEEHGPLDRWRRRGVVE